jgi:site-specific DNA-adenine methylase
MNERMNAHVVQVWKVILQQGQEIITASSSLLVSVREHKYQVKKIFENLRHEISGAKEYADS